MINKGSLKYFGDPVDMVGMAAGKVWQFDIGKTEFEQALDKSRIVNHIQKRRPYPGPLPLDHLSV